MRGFTHEGAGSPEWYTPPEVFSALGLTFDLDPCAPPLPAASWIPAARRYTLPVDGLAEPWEGRICAEAVRRSGLGVCADLVGDRGLELAAAVAPP